MTSPRYARIGSESENLSHGHHVRMPQSAQLRGLRVDMKLETPLTCGGAQVWACPASRSSLDPSHACRPAGIKLGVIGVDHRQLSKNGLLRVDVTIFTVGEIPRNPLQGIIDELALERRLT